MCSIADLVTTFILTYPPTNLPTKLVPPTFDIRMVSRYATLPMPIMVARTCFNWSCLKQIYDIRAIGIFKCISTLKN